LIAERYISCLLTAARSIFALWWQQDILCILIASGNISCAVIAAIYFCPKVLFAICYVMAVGKYHPSSNCKRTVSVL